MSLWVAFGAAVHTGTLWLWGYSTVTAERCHLSKQNPSCARGAQPAVTLTPVGTARGTLRGHWVASRCSQAALPLSGARQGAKAAEVTGGHGVPHCTPSCCHTRGCGLCLCHPAGTCGTMSSERWGQPAPADVLLATQICSWTPRYGPGHPDKVLGAQICAQAEGLCPGELGMGCARG